MSKSEQWSVKYRPQTIDEFVGNSGAIAYIKGLEKSKRTPGCVLVAGESGTGKTSFARNAACLFSGWEGHPDDNPDIIELSCNEDSSKEDVKKAIEQSRYSPRGGKRRCMIADEAHAYTGQAASALLKACEEPPAKTTWFLCTDKPEKLPRQLAMRAQQVSLTAVDEADMTKLLKWILSEEKIKLGTKQEAILKRIVDASFGIPRQGIQLLESVATCIIGGASPSEALKMAIKSGSSTESLETSLLLIQYFVEGSTNKAIAAINTCNSEGVTELMLRVLSSLIFKANGNNPRDGLGWVAVKGYQGSCSREQLPNLLTLQSRLISSVQARIASNYAISTESLLLNLVKK